MIGFHSLQQDVVSNICQAADRHLVQLVEWAKHIPHFTDLPIEDQVVLLKAGKLSCWLHTHYHWLSFKLSHKCPNPSVWTMNILGWQWLKWNREYLVTSLVSKIVSAVHVQSPPCPHSLQHNQSVNCVNCCFDLYLKQILPLQPSIILLLTCTVWIYFLESSLIRQDSLQQAVKILAMLSNLYESGRDFTTVVK